MSVWIRVGRLQSSTPRPGRLRWSRERATRQQRHLVSDPFIVGATAEQSVCRWWCPCCRCSAVTRSQPGETFSIVTKTYNDAQTDSLGWYHSTNDDDAEAAGLLGLVVLLPLRFSLSTAFSFYTSSSSLSSPFFPFSLHCFLFLFLFFFSSLLLLVFLAQCQLIFSGWPSHGAASWR